MTNVKTDDVFGIRALYGNSEWIGRMESESDQSSRYHWCSSAEHTRVHSELQETGVSSIESKQKNRHNTLNPNSTIKNGITFYFLVVIYRIGSSPQAFGRSIIETHLSS